MYRDGSESCADVLSCKDEETYAQAADAVVDGLSGVVALFSPDSLF